MSEIYRAVSAEWMKLNSELGAAHKALCDNHNDETRTAYHLAEARERTAWAILDVVYKEIRRQNNR
jgi:hypothetical protein